MPDKHALKTPSKGPSMISNKSMKISLKEIKEEESSYSFSEQNSWVLTIVEGADEKDDEQTQRQRARPANLPPSSTKASKQPRSISVVFKLKASNNIYYVGGEIHTQVHLICSRCASTFNQEIDGKFKTLFSEDKNLGESTVLKNMSFNIEDLEDLDEIDDEITILEEKFLDLSEILNEQLQLLIPFQPLCKTDCRGICQQCGTNLNDGKCACEKLVKQNPFSVLKDMDTKSSKSQQKKRDK